MAEKRKSPTRKSPKKPDKLEISAKTRDGVMMIKPLSMKALSMKLTIVKPLAVKNQ